jgi:hypothetical protein
MTASYNLSFLCENPVFYTENMGTRRDFPWLKQPERETEHSPASSTKVKNEWRPTSTPLYAFMLCIGTNFLYLFMYQVMVGKYCRMECYLK